MAKRKRLGPAVLTDTPPAAPERKNASTPPIAGVAGDAALAHAVQELGAKLSQARVEGRLIERLPLDAIHDDYLVRDRLRVDDDEMEALKASLRETGQQTAIEVVPLEAGNFGLISGWRRLQALRDLALEGSIDTVLAIARIHGDSAEAYRAMVEENEIRSGLSFYERGRIVARAVDAGAYADDGAALSGLFHAVPRARRSKIGSFVRLVRALDDALRFPTALSERAGLALAGALKDDPDLAARLTAALRRADPADAEAEQAVIDSVLKGPAKPRPALPVTELARGVRYTRKPDGTVVLKGAALKDDDFADALLQTLKSLE